MALFSNRHAAVAAGLGEIGWNGFCLTPDNGPRQRFVHYPGCRSLEGCGYEMLQAVELARDDIQTLTFAGPKEEASASTEPIIGSESGRLGS